MMAKSGEERHKNNEDNSKNSCDSRILNVKESGLQYKRQRPNHRDILDGVEHLFD